MKKIFILISVISLSLLLIGCKSNSKNKNTDVAKLNSEKLSETETIIITKSAYNTTDPEIKKITDKNIIDNIIVVLSSATKLSNNENINVRESHILELLDNNDIIIEVITIASDRISLENDNNSYSLNIDDLIKIIEK